jgi:hypothetical protein
MNGEKTYNGCPKKIKARKETIIQPYRELFSFSLPFNKQYWTMCATHYSKNYNLLNGCELDQMLQSELITAEQFHGVDIKPKIIEGNRKTVPDAHWHCGDFYKTLIEAKNEEYFNPGIVFCDHLKMPESGGAEYAAKILALLADLENVMLTVNLIVRARHNFSSRQEMYDTIQKTPQYSYACEKGWKIYKESELYGYRGTGANHTDLATIVFYHL